ncbi:MAG: FHA domain-containing protein [Steroidobacteraceae bacterium]
MTLALEINDVGLVLAADGELLADEPGYAMLDGREPETGTAAARRSRLKPLYAETRHWQDLGTSALARPMPAATTHAEVAYAQLASLVRPHLARGPQLLVATPPWYTREQLALLLGIAQEAGLEPVGLVDAGLAAASLEPAPDSVLQLELGLHRAVLSVLDRGGDLRRTRYDLLPQHGWLALQQAWLDLVAATFVRKTRYDPLHEATTEQRLCDGLPAWLERLNDASTVTITVEATGGPHTIELANSDFAAAAARIYDEYARVLQRARSAGGPLHVRLSHRLATLPGLDARLGEIRDCELVRLPRGAAALGALAYEAQLRQGGNGGVALVQHLPVPVRPGVARAPAASSRIPPDARPTHVVFQGRAYPIDARPLLLGSAVGDGRRAVPIPPGPGISRAHCTLVREDGAAWLEDHSTYGTLVNDERTRGRVELRAGDRLRLGSPGVECELVRMVDDDGAA